MVTPESNGHIDDTVIKKPGRFTPENRKVILEHLKDGNYIGTACRAAKVRYRRFKKWMEQGRSGRPEDAEYKAFMEDVIATRATAEAELVSFISGHDDWRARAWVLERSHPDHWGQQSKVVHTGPTGGPIMTEARIERIDQRIVEFDKRTAESLTRLLNTPPPQALPSPESNAANDPQTTS
jgi:hypothetical protein